MRLKITKKIALGNERAQCAWALTTGREFTRVAQALQRESAHADARGKGNHLTNTMWRNGRVIRFGGLKADTRGFVAGSGNASPSDRSSALGQFPIPEQGFGNRSKPEGKAIEVARQTRRRGNARLRMGSLFLSCLADNINNFVGDLRNGLYPIDCRVYKPDNTSRHDVCCESCAEVPEDLKRGAASKMTVPGMRKHSP